MDRRRGQMKGTVTPMSSVLPPEEARKAAAKVAEAISDKESELSHLSRFVADNDSLIKLVKRLPDDLHHDIMVPFGKAAFFPGRLVHTNEFLVLLGEGYHAERTSKQTVDILKRRGKALDAQVDAFKGVIKDLRLEESFFSSTAAEGEEGLLEIREEYIEEDPEESTLKTGLKKSDKRSSSRLQSMTNVASDDAEDALVKARMDEQGDEEKYAHIDDKERAKMMARLDELEREEEEEAASVDADDDKEYAKIMARLNELEREEEGGGGEEEEEEEEEEVEEDEAADDEVDDQERAQKISGLSDWVCEEKNCTGLQSSVKGEPPSKKDYLHSMTERSAETHAVASEVNIGVQTAPKSDYKVSTEMSKPDTGSRISRPITDSQKAFSGSIIEHSDNLPAISSQAKPSQPSSSQSSRPVSRFKMQRK